MNVSYEGGHERASSQLFHCVLPILRVLIILSYGYIKCSILYELDRVRFDCLCVIFVGDGLKRRAGKEYGMKEAYITNDEISCVESLVDITRTFYKIQSARACVSMCVCAEGI
jgi:hypothetical protein